MSWKQYDIYSYKASAGAGDYYYGGIQLFGKEFYALLKFHKEDPLPDATAPVQYEQRFYGHLDFQQMEMIVDLLRNEKPIRFGWNIQDPNQFHLMTGQEPVGEGDGIISQDTP